MKAAPAHAHESHASSYRGRRLTRSQYARVAQSCACPPKHPLPVSPAALCSEDLPQPLIPLLACSRSTEHSRRPSTSPLTISPVSLSAMTCREKYRPAFRPSHPREKADLHFSHRAHVKRQTCIFTPTRPQHAPPTARHLPKPCANPASGCPSAPSAPHHSHHLCNAQAAIARRNVLTLRSRIIVGQTDSWHPMCALARHEVARMDLLRPIRRQVIIKR